MTVPTREGLAAPPVHVIVREFPETLAVLREAGVDVPRRGGGAVTEATDDPDAVLDALRAATAWRDGGPGPRPDGTDG